MNKASKDLLPPFFYKYYREFEASTSLEAKYAKALDKLSPLFNDLANIEFNKRRSMHYRFGVTDVIEKVRPYLEWDSVLLAIFDYWAERMR